MQTADILTQLSLNKKEVAIFTACSERFLRASEVSSIVKEKRTNVYALLNGLVEKSLIVEVTRGKVKKFRAVSISRLYDVIEKQKLELQTDTKKLDSLLDLIDKEFHIQRHANVIFYNGLEEVSRFYRDSYERAGKEEIKTITRFMRYSMLGNVIDEGNTIAQKTYNKLKSRYIPEKMIVPDTENTRRIISYQTKRHPDYMKFQEFRLINFDNLSVESDISISETGVAFTTVTEIETWAVKFLDDPIRNTFEALFSVLWATGRPPD